MTKAGYTRRLVDHALDELLPELPAIALQGAKGVGKTATGRRRVSRVVRLDVEEERVAFAAAPFDLEPEGTLLLDEWQRFPASWDQVRRAVDDGATGGSFLLTGSTAPKGATVHSGAGRIVSLTMRPLSLAERGVDQPSVSLAHMLLPNRVQIEGSTAVGLPEYVSEIFASGFPGIRSLSHRVRNARLDGYIENTVQREFAEQGINVRRPQTLLAWLRSYAAATGTTASYTNILDASTPGVSAKPSHVTTLVYRDVLSRVFVLDPLEAWIPTMNPLKRLAASPKHYLVDPALAARMLNLDADAVLAGIDASAVRLNQGSMLGPLFEALAVQSVRVYADTIGAQSSHFRQRDGRHEADIIVQKGTQFVGFEVKLATAVSDHDVRHLLWLRSELGDTMADMVVLTTGTQAYRRPDGVAVVPLALLGP